METMDHAIVKNAMHFLQIFRIAFRKRTLNVVFAGEKKKGGFRGIQIRYEFDHNSILSLRTWRMGWLKTSSGRMRVVYFHRNQILKKVT